MDFCVQSILLKRIFYVQLEFLCGNVTWIGLFESINFPIVIIKSHVPTYRVVCVVINIVIWIFMFVCDSAWFWTENISLIENWTSNRNFWQEQNRNWASTNQFWGGCHKTIKIIHRRDWLRHSLYSGPMQGLWSDHPDKIWGNKRTWYHQFSSPTVDSAL